MLKSLVYNRKTKSSVNSVGNVIFLILLGTALLNLQTPTREYLVLYAPYLMLMLQVGLPMMLFPRLRLCLDKVYNNVMFVFVLLYLLFLFSLLSGFWGNLPGLVLQRSLMIYIPVLLIGLMVWADPKPLVTFVKIARGLVFFASTLAAIGILLYFFGSEVQIEGTRVQTLSLGPITLAQSVSGISPLLRISSLMGNPNTLAMWLLLSLPLTLYLIHIRKIGKWLGKITLVLQFIALVLTFSRAGIGATLLALAAYYYLSAPYFAIKLKRFLFGLAVAGVVAGGIFMLGLDKLDSQRFSIDLNRRDEAWDLLINAFKESPFLGVGFGLSYESVLEPYGLEITSHNAHLHILSEIGILGYCLFLILWLFPLRKSLIEFRDVLVKEQRFTLIVGASLLVSLFAHQFFESSLLRYGFHTLFWGYLLFVVVHPRMKGVT